MSRHHFITLKTKVEQARQLLLCDRTAKRFTHLNHYLSPQTIGGYIGFLGHQNLGDDILFESFKTLFPKLQLLAYDGATDPVHNPPFSYYPLELALYQQWIKPERFYDLVFLGGGTLINRRQYLYRLRHALKNGDRCVVFGTGVAEPRFWQEQDGSEDFLHQIQEWVTVLKEVDKVYVRGPHSAQTLANYSLNDPKVIGDPALSICQSRPLNYSQTGTIGINIGSHGVLWGEASQVHNTIVELIHQLLASGRRVELLPFHQQDLDLSNHIAQHIDSLQLSIWPHYRQIERTLQRIQTYDVLIGQRLHSVILACGCGVPFIALKYAPKCEDFLDSVGLHAFSLRTNELEVAILLSLVQQIEQTYDRHCQQLVDISNDYRQRQHQAAQSIQSNLDPLNSNGL